MKWLYGTIHDFPQTEYDRIRELLTPSRKVRIENLKSADLQKRSLTGDLLAEKLTGGQIEMALSGQPHLIGSSMHISIAHSGDAVVCAAAETPVGIDIEKIRPTKPGMLQKVCTPEELEYAQQEESRFFEIWTAKEAYFKMKGTGITNFQDINTLSLHRQIFRKDN